MDARYHQINNAGRVFSLIKKSRLSATLDLIQLFLVVIREFNKKLRQMRRMYSLDRVFQSMGILVNEEGAVLEETVEASGK